MYRHLSTLTLHYTCDNLSDTTRSHILGVHFDPIIPSSLLGAVCGRARWIPPPTSSSLLLAKHNRMNVLEGANRQTTSTASPTTVDKQAMNLEAIVHRYYMRDYLS